MASEAKVIDTELLDTTPPTVSDGAQIFEIQSQREMPCAGKCGKRGKWRFCTQNYVCGDCRQSHPAHKLIVRSTAKGRYHLTYEQLFEAFQRKEIDMITVKNRKGGPPCRLYYEYQILSLAQRLHAHRSNHPL